MQKEKHTMILAANCRPIISSDFDEHLSIASLKQLKKFLPDVDVNRNYDLLGVAFNSCVVNRPNKNDDVIDTENAISIYSTFINKPINIEHSRKQIIGCIVTAGFTEFGTDNPLTLEQVKDMKEPFNIALGGVIWKTANKAVADYIEQSGDPESPNYLEISASWELSFEDVEIVISEDPKSIMDASFITEEAEVEKLKGKLRAYGGEGIINGKRAFRKPGKTCIATGIAFTENPAAEVKGIISENEKIIESISVESNIKSENITDNNEKIISHIEGVDVKQNSINMKITSMADITDESLKTMKASVMHEFLEEKIKEADKQFKSEKEKIELAAKEKETLLTTTAAELKKAQEELTKLNEAVAEFKQLEQDRKEQEVFNTRIEGFHAEYDLEQEDVEIVASDIKGLNDEAFAKYQKKAFVLFKSKNKKGKDAAKKAGEEKAKEDAKASVETVVDKALENAEAKNKIPATPATQISLKDKFRAAFAPENIIVKK